MNPPTQRSAKIIDSINTFRTVRAPLRPRVFRDGTGPTYSYLGPGVSGRCLVDSSGTGGTFAAFEITVAPGAGMPPHVHQNEDETFYVLEGRFAINRGNEQFELETGTALHGPRDIAHGFRNLGPTTGRLLILSTPGGLEDLFAALDGRRVMLGSLKTREAQTEYGLLLEEYDIHPVMESLSFLRHPLPAHSAAIAMGDYRVRCLISSEETGGMFLLSDLKVDVQGGPPPHVHHEEDEALFILSGSLEVLVGERLVELGAGDVFFGPRHVAHGWHNRGTEPVLGLRLVTPGENAYTFAQEIQSFLREAGSSTLSQVQDPELVQRMSALFEQHDLEAAVPIAGR